MRISIARAAVIKGLREPIIMADADGASEVSIPYKVARAAYLMLAAGLRIDSAEFDDDTPLYQPRPRKASKGVKHGRR